MCRIEYDTFEQTQNHQRPLGVTLMGAKNSNKGKFKIISVLRE
jgi:hypothetical protein